VAIPAKPGTFGNMVDRKVLAEQVSTVELERIPIYALKARGEEESCIGR
jgi:hypothetical protein